MLFHGALGQNFGIGYPSIPMLRIVSLEKISTTQPSLIDLFSLYVLFSHCRSCDDTLRPCLHGVGDPGLVG